MPCDAIDKLEWAEQHIFKLKEFCDAFRNDAYPVEFHDTYDGQYRLYYLGRVQHIPADVPLLIGDAVHNLRSALDHLIYRAAYIFTSGSGPFDALYFPMAKDLSDFRGKLIASKERKTKPGGVIQRLDDAVINNVELIEPYGGGTGEILWHIHQLDIRDKHHLLLTVSSQNRLRSMSPAEIANIRRQFAGELASVPTVHDPKLFLKEGRRHISLETGHILDFIPTAEAHENMEFPVEVAFGEPKVLKGKPVVETLYHAAHFIRGIITTFDSEGLLG